MSTSHANDSKEGSLSVLDPEPGTSFLRHLPLVWTVHIARSGSEQSLIDPSQSIWWSLTGESHEPRSECVRDAFPTFRIPNSIATCRENYVLIARCKCKLRTSRPTPHGQSPMSNKVPRSSHLPVLSCFNCSSLDALSPSLPLSLPASLPPCPLSCDGPSPSHYFRHRFENSQHVCNYILTSWLCHAPAAACRCPWIVTPCISTDSL